jgi:putative transposase
MARGNNGQPVFLDEVDYQGFLTALRLTRARYPCQLYAYVLMPNHVHLLVEVGATPTGKLMQGLLTGYVRTFNRRHNRRGHLFQGRYKAILCDRDSYLLELVRYIHLNPVRAGLVTQPAAWTWSGHREYLGQDHRGLIDPGPVMEELGSARRYEAFVREGARGAYRPEWHPGEQAPFLGRPAFVKRLQQARAPEPRARPRSLEWWCQAVATPAGLSVEALRARGRTGRLVAARDRFIQRAVWEGGHRAGTVAAFLGCHPSNITRALQKGGAAG